MFKSLCCTFVAFLKRLRVSNNLFRRRHGTVSILSCRGGSRGLRFRGCLAPWSLRRGLNLGLSLDGSVDASRSLPLLAYIRMNLFLHEYLPVRRSCLLDFLCPIRRRGFAGNQG